MERYFSAQEVSEFEEAILALFKTDEDMRQHLCLLTKKGKPTWLVCLDDDFSDGLTEVGFVEKTKFEYLEFWQTGSGYSIFGNENLVRHITLP